MSSYDSPKLGLRERKKMKTRASIQQHAMRLFREQGYYATTIEQIADAAEISPSTFFRYFPTKEASVLEDDYDPLLIQAFQEQPVGLSPIQTLRNAVKSGFSVIPQEERDGLRERLELAYSIPELRAASLNQMMQTLEMLAKIVGARYGYGPEDSESLTLAGAVVGIFMGVLAYAMKHPEADLLQLMDNALAQLEAGFPLINESTAD